MVSIRKSAPIRVKVYAPQTQDGKIELSKRVAQIHADAVTRRIKDLNCPTYQKLQLVDAIIQAIRNRMDKTIDISRQEKPANT